MDRPARLVADDCVRARPMTRACVPALAGADASATSLTPTDTLPQIRRPDRDHDLAIFVLFLGKLYSRLFYCFCSSFNLLRRTVLYYFCERCIVNIT